MNDVADASDRRTELAANLADVRARLAAACATAKRDPAELTLIAVTKTWPASDVLHLAALGLTEMGENRDQEAAPKAAEVAAALSAPGAAGGGVVRWHFVGQLQRNKAKSVVEYAHLVHSVDSVRLATALGEAAGRLRAEPLGVLVQVSIDGASGRGGAGSTELDAVLAAAAGTAGLVLRGLMAVAPLGWEPARAYERLAEIAVRVRGNYPQATILSAGMSGDFEQAINYGATHVRLGTSLLGNRPRLL